MMEYVQAHATYRFILHDDEEERPRILVRCCSYGAFRRNLTPTADLVVQAEHADRIRHSNSVPLAEGGEHPWGKNTVQDSGSRDRFHRFRQVGGE